MTSRDRFGVLSGLSGEQEPPHGQVGQRVPRRLLVLTNVWPGVDRHTLSNSWSAARLRRGHEEANFRFIAKTVASAEVVSHERPIDVGRSWDRSVHTSVRLVGGRLGEIPDQVEFHGGFIAPNAEVQVEWASLRQAMRSWSISRSEDLTIWLRTNGSPATTRAQERIMIEAYRMPGWHCSRQLSLLWLRSEEDRWGCLR